MWVLSWVLNPDRVGKALGLAGNAFQIFGVTWLKAHPRTVLRLGFLGGWRRLTLEERTSLGHFLVARVQHSSFGAMTLPVCRLMHLKEFFGPRGASVTASAQPFLGFLRQKASLRPV